MRKGIEKYRKERREEASGCGIKGRENWRERKGREKWRGEKGIEK